ncbi:MAG: ABC transporter permease [Eubacteriales bacterium]|nr:ABC transporter permease [Eubacteriales bacterium]
MKQFMTVLKFELNSYFKNKSFVLTTLLLAVVMAGALIIPTFIPGLLGNGGKSARSESSSEEEMETLGIYVHTDTVKDVDALLSLMPVEWENFKEEDRLKSAVERNVIKAGFIIESASDVTYVVNNLAISDEYSYMFEEALRLYQRQQYLLDKGLSPEEAAEAENMTVSVTPEILGKNSARNYGYTYALVFFVYILIIFYGQMIAVSVTTEKSNRAIEILVTSVNPNSLIFGKVLAGAIAGVVQAVLILGTGFVSYNAVKDAWGGKLDFLFQIPSRVLAAYAVFALLSYLLYAFIFGMLGAMVSKTEDISKSATPVTMIYVVSFLISMLGMTDSDSLLMKVASFIPFTSGNAMFIRVSMGSVALWETIISGGLLILSCAAAGVLAVKIFRFGTLYYGNPLKFTAVLRRMRQQ